MTREPGDELDPEVLSDPVEDEPGAQREDATSPVDAETALVSASDRALVPADPFRRYLAEIRRYPPLDRERERELARLYRDTGDREALFRLVTANLMLVVRVAFSFRRAARNLLDLVQEGNLGLLQAIERFDPEVGVRLPTYAAWWIRAYMVKFLLDNVRLVRVGTTNSRRKLLRNLRKEKLRLEQLGYDTGPRQLAEHFGVSETDVRDVQMALESRDVSLDEPVTDDSAQLRGDLIPDEDQPDVEQTVARAEMQQRVEAALAKFRVDLDERERLLLDERILSDDPRTLQSIGEKFGTTREAARQAEVRLMRRLKEFLGKDLGDLGQIRIGPG